MPLELAINKGFREIVELLLRAGANVNAKTKHNSTALHAAARRGDLETCRILIDHGAKSVKRKNGETPKDVAVRSLSDTKSGVRKARLVETIELLRIALGAK